MSSAEVADSLARLTRIASTLPKEPNIVENGHQVGPFAAVNPRDIVVVAGSIAKPTQIVKDLLKGSSSVHWDDQVVEVQIQATCLHHLLAQISPSPATDTVPSPSPTPVPVA